MEHKGYIVIDQAYYGEVQLSHGCIYSSIDHSRLKAFLTGFTDRPSSLPAGVAMAPYYSAIAYEDYYIVTLTLPDTNAPRAGMVFTHALILRVEDLSSINDLEDLFTYFTISIPQQKGALGALKISPSLPADYSAEITFLEYIQQTASKLISESHPILFCGTLASFAKTLAVIWRGLPPTFRQRFTYTAAFSSISIDSSKAILYFQQDLDHLLRGLDHVSDKNEQLVRTESTVNNFILSPGSTNQLDKFIKILNVHLDDWNILQYCARAFGDYQHFGQLGNDALKQLIRRIAMISPSPGNGKGIKIDVIEELMRRIADGRDGNIKSLRNLPLNAYESDSMAFETSVSAQITREFDKKKDFAVEWIAEMGALLQKESQQNWWHVAVKKAFSIVTREGTEVATVNIWKLLCHSFDSLSAVVEILPVHVSYEDVLLKSQPASIPAVIAEKFADIVAQRKWTLLHAHLVQIYLSPKEAIKKQLDLERNLSISSLPGTGLIEKKISNSDLLALAFETADEFYIAAYAERTVSEQGLLNRLDVGDNSWLRIWGASLSLTHSLQRGVSELPRKVEAILSHLVQGATIPDPIINLISNSSFADISNHPQRDGIWKCLPIANKSNFLHATANSLIASLGKGDTAAPIALEDELSAYIRSDTYMAVMLNNYRTDINTVLEVYEYLPGQKDTLLANYIQKYSHSLSEMQATRLGLLIVKYQFRLSARQVFEKAKSQPNFRFTLSHCRSLADIGLLERVIYHHLLGESLSSNSVYAALTELSIQLYDQGPEQNDIWRRAGGDLSKLHQHKTREDNWRHAIHLLKNGGGNKGISSKSLVKEMLVDYPFNPQLKELSKII